MLRGNRTTVATAADVAAMATEALKVLPQPVSIHLRPVGRTLEIHVSDVADHDAWTAWWDAHGAADWCDEVQRSETDRSVNRHRHAHASWCGWFIDATFIEPAGAP